MSGYAELPSSGPVAHATDQILIHRNVCFVVGAERSGLRKWVIYPPSGPTEGACAGKAAGEGGRGSFRLAVTHARQAIDQWLDDPQG